MKSNYKRIGDYIRLVDNRNTDLSVENLLGLSITKEFVPSVANTIGTDMSKYKIVKKNQFACSTMQVRRDKKMPVALLQHVNEGIISPAYYVFEVIDEDILLPEYLMMWFSRSEFDREACFYAIGGVRGSLEWEDFCDMKLPVPSIEKQIEIIKEYNTILNRIKLNENMITYLEDLSQTVYKQWFIDFHYPYKDNGIEVPENWENGNLDLIIDFKNGKKVGAETGDIPVYGGNGILGYTKEFNAENGTAIGRVGAYCGMSYREFNKMWISDNGIFAKDKEGLNNYAFYLISNLKLNERAEGTGQPLITQNMLNNISISVPPKKLRVEFDCMIGKILTLINIKKREIKMMNVLKEINLSMISK